jgi:integrase
MATPKITTLRLPLTKRNVDAIPVPPKGELTKAYDTRLRNYWLEISDRTRTYRVYGRPNGRQVIHTVGRHGEITPEAAYAAAKRALGMMRGGTDPNTTKREARATEKERRAAPTITDLWTRYSAEVVSGNKATTAGEKWRMWKAKIEPAIGTVAVRAVDADRLGRIIRGPLRIEPKTGRIIGGKGEAGNLYRLLHHMMAKAIRWKMRDPGTNPLDDIDEPKVPPRKRLLRDGEMAALWAALAEIESDLPWQVAAALRFTLMTGWRATEVATLRHDYLHHDRGEAHLPDTKTDFSARPLAREVFEQIEKLPLIVGSPWVFPAVKDATRPLSYDTLEDAFGKVRAKAGLTDVSLHTLRHRIVTEIAGEAKNLREGMAVSGHKSVAAYMGYVHADRDRVAAIAEAVTARIAALEGKPKAEVAKLPRRA